jgi:molecular chaperone Hsp33
MDDYLVRIFARDAGVRAFAGITTNTVAEACRRHETPPLASIALGEALTGGILLGSLLKIGQRVAIKFFGNESRRRIVIESANNGKVRGYASVPEGDNLLTVPWSSEPIRTARHFIEPDGQLTVVKDLRLKNLYESVVSLTGEGIIADLNSYLNQSEQIPSVLEAGVVLAESEPEQVVTAGGLLVQALPPYEADVVYRLADRVQELPPVEAMLSSGRTPEEILSELFEEISYEELEVMPLAYSCTCSRDRSRKALISLGREELIHLLETEGRGVVNCQFCHEQYLFDGSELSDLIELLWD